MRHKQVELSRGFACSRTVHVFWSIKDVRWSQKIRVGWIGRIDNFQSISVLVSDRLREPMALQTTESIVVGTNWT